MSDNAVSHNLKVSNKFFDKLVGKARNIVDEESQKMANSMEYILRHRQTFKEVGGQYPKWDPSPKFKPKSKESFKNWKVQKRKNGEYWLGNVSSSRWGTYNYVAALVTGKGWNTSRVGWNNNNAGPNNHKLVRGADGGLYSSQMPNGLDPWKKVKREDLSYNIIKRFAKEL